MEARKIIQVGRSSYVVSIPKEWVSAHKLKKGDFIFLQRNSNGELIVKPREKAVEKENCLTININGKNLTKINRELISAYINNFNKIVLIGENIRKMDRELTALITDKIGLAVVEKNANSFVVKDLLDPRSAPLEHTITRMESLLREMFQELRKGLKQASFPKSSLEELYQLDSELNKLYFLIWKIVRKCQGEEDLRVALNLTSRELTVFQWFALYFEQIGDELKRIAKILAALKVKKELREELEKLVAILEKRFLDVAEAYHKSKKERAIELAETKEQDFLKLEQFMKVIKDPYLGMINEKLRSTRAYIHHMAKLVAY